MISKRFQVDEENSNNRVDIFLAKNLDSISRGIVQQLILKGQVLVNDQQVKRNHILKINDVIDISFEIEPEGDDEAQDIHLNIVFENDDFFVIDKQAGLTVHPGAGQKDSTLINGMLYLRPKQRELPRYGLVHRLDKDTSGLMLLAKSIQSHTILTDLIQNKKIKRNYYALVHGDPISGKTINLPIGRHPKNRLLFCVKEGGRSAVTHFKIKDRYKNFSLLDIELETGRTHQIRVHLKHIGHPIVGDKSYNNIKIWKNADPTELKAVTDLNRQALHSYNLSFTYLDKEFNFESEVPSDFAETCTKLEK
tara:strand:+ start:24262 stop:25185 length:924 start_codon:yes stop_codon:yes gene_type:complete